MRVIFGILLILLGIVSLSVPTWFSLIMYSVLPVLSVGLIIWGGVVLWPVITRGGSRTIGEALSSLQRVPQNQADTEKWEALVRYDDDLGAAMERLTPHGSRALEKFRRTYLSVNDRSKIDVIVEDLRAEFPVSDSGSGSA